MSEHTGELMSVKIIPNDKGNPPGKLADAEVIFEADAGPLSGLKLIGFSVWERRDGGKNVTFPARQYVAAVPPAISGQHGDVHTFRVCCRVVRGFALADDEALDVLRDWNSRCEPPWSDRELIDKLSRARRYGREPIGCLLEERP